MSAFRVIRVSDRSECEQCGRTGLKRTIHLENVETGDDVYFGTDCAATVLRQQYNGRMHRLSTSAILEKAKAAMLPRERQERMGYYKDAFIVHGAA